MKNVGVETARLFLVAELWQYPAHQLLLMTPSKHAMFAVQDTQSVTTLGFHNVRRESGCKNAVITGDFVFQHQAHQLSDTDCRTKASGCTMDCVAGSKRITSDIWRVGV